MVAKRASAEERLHAVVDRGKRAGPALARDLRPFLHVKGGIVAAAAAKIVAEHALRDLERDLEEAFLRFLEQPVKTDPGCRAKLATAEALRKLDVRAPDVYLRGVNYRQLEPSYGPPIDTAVPIRVCCAAALLETRHPRALAEVAPLLADPEANTRVGVASVLGGIGGEACDALLRLKVRVGDTEPEVTGACLDALLRASFEDAFPFVLGTMRDAREDVLRLALLALGESRDDRAVPALCEYAEAPGSKEVRSTALLALSIARLPMANEYLLSLVERAPDRRALEVIFALESQRLDSGLMDRLGAIATTRGDPVQSAFREMMRRS